MDSVFLFFNNFVIQTFPDGSFSIANYTQHYAPLYFAAVYFFTTCMMVTLHNLRAQISLGPVLALSALLTFLVWQLAQIGWWVDWQDYKINAAFLAIVPALMIGSTLTYAIDGVRAARAYHLILLCSSAFSIGYAYFVQTLGQFTPTPSFIFAPISTQIARALSLVAAGIMCSVGYEVARRISRWIALPAGFLAGYASFLPLFSLTTYGLDQGMLNINMEWPEYVLIGAPAAITLVFYGLMAIRSNLILPARPIGGILGFAVSPPSERNGRESILEAREQIAELRQLNQALRQQETLRFHHMEKSPLAMLELDRQGRLLRFNPAAQNLLGQGVDPRQPLLEGQSLYTYFPELKNVIAESKPQKTQILKPMLSVAGKDGNVRTVEFTILPLFMDKSIAGYSILAEDVSAREQAATKRLLSERVREIHKTSQVIHHDFSNLLLAIQGHLSILKQKFGNTADAELQNAIGAIFNASRRGKEMLGQLGAGQVFQHPELKPHNLKSLLMEAVHIITPQAKSQQVKLLLDINDHVDIEVDSSQILRVLLNLLSNAIRAMPQGGQISITTECLDQGALIRIQDTGIGMSVEQLNKAFDPGFSTKGQGQGGLGLAISYLITEAHGGRLSLESEQGRGTTAKIWLPIAERLMEADLPLERMVNARAIVTKARDYFYPQEGVLLLLSQNDLRQQLAAEFQSIGCEVAELQDYNELKAVLEENASQWTVLVRGKSETMPRELWHECRFLCDVVIDPSGKDPLRIRPSSKSQLNAEIIQDLLQAA